MHLLPAVLLAFGDAVNNSPPGNPGEWEATEQQKRVAASTSHALIFIYSNWLLACMVAKPACKRDTGSLHGAADNLESRSEGAVLPHFS